jgi:hypothetical protein
MVIILILYYAVKPHDNYSEQPIFITSWEALYFYRFYFEAVTLM